MFNLPSSSQPAKPSDRLYYLDWLRVIAILGVFLFHAVHPFDLTPWHIKNAEQSLAITIFIAFMYPWGMPFFFLLAGASSWFALRRRTSRQFVRERFYRLLLPFIAGSLLLMPIMLYFEWSHKTQTGLFHMPFREFLLDRNVGFTPIWFGALGYHLWFLGFLFSFSLLALPLCAWLNGEDGKRWVVAGAAAMGLALASGSFDLQSSPQSLRDFLFWFLISVDSWCWTIFFLSIGMRFLNRSNQYLEYGQEAILPFFVFHQPVIILLAYVAVRWQASLPVKLMFVVLGSFALSLGIYEYLIRRVDPLRLVFGMKMRRLANVV